MKRCARTLRHEHVVSVRFTIDLIGKKICLSPESCSSSLLKSERDGNQSAVARNHGIIRPTLLQYKEDEQRPKRDKRQRGNTYVLLSIPWSLFPDLLLQECMQPFQIWPFLSTLQMLPDDERCEWLSTLISRPTSPPSAQLKPTHSLSHAPIQCFLADLDSGAGSNDNAPRPSWPKHMRIKYLLCSA